MHWKTHCVLMMQLENKNVSEQQKMIFQFHLITIMIQNQAIHHPNPRHHLLKNPHYQLNTLMIMKKHPWEKLILDHGHQKNKFQKQSRSYISSLLVTKTLNIYTYCLYNRQIYSNMKVLVTKFMKIYKMTAVRQ